MISAWLRSLWLAALCLIVSVCLVQTGCSKKSDNKGGDNSKITKANFEKIKDKMPEKEVVDLLGASTELKDIEGGKEHTWKSGNNKIQVGFKDGKVEYKTSQFVN